MIELIRLIENEVSWCIFAIDIVPCLKVIKCVSFKKKMLINDRFFHARFHAIPTSKITTPDTFLTPYP